jgi:hypothetical protein
MAKILSLLILLACIYSCERDTAEFEYRIIGEGKYKIEYKTEQGEMVSHRVLLPWEYSGRIDGAAHLYLKVPSWEPRVELHTGDMPFLSSLEPDSTQIIDIVVVVYQDFK